MNKQSGNICILPSQKDAWLIHGVWPTKYGKFGPFFCNASAPFDINSLNPIIDQMKQYWTNIEKGKYQAIVAMNFQPISIELKYF